MRSHRGLLALSLLSLLGGCADERADDGQGLVDEPGEGSAADHTLVGEPDPGAGLTKAPIVADEPTIDLGLTPFTTDGCSMFPDGTPTDQTKWQHCCIKHDFAYYLGGPSELREAADETLSACVAEVSSGFIAGLMYYGVRLGGTPALPTPWRWGYGWAYDPDHGYRELSPEEEAAALREIEAYQEHPVPPLALEQRLLAYWESIVSVPGLPAVIDELEALISALDP